MLSQPDQKRLMLVLSVVLVAVLFSLWLPDMALNTGLADTVVGVTNTGAWPWLVFLALGLIVAVVSRGGISHHRRRREAAAFGVVLLVFLAGNAALNEYVVKPLFGIPRPNIEELAETGALGPDLADAEAFYEVGDKEARRDVLGEELATLTTPALSERVRAHWAHETGYSFPSGHATAAMTLAALFAAAATAWLAEWRRILVLLVLPAWAVAVAYSRVLLDVHRGVDVIAGTVAGLGWGLVAFGAVQWGLASARPAGDGGEAA